MTHEFIRPEGVLNLPSYSHAVVKTGTPVFIAGQVGRDADGNLVGGDDAGEQARAAYANVKRVIEACGGTLADVVKFTVFATDAAHLPAITAARIELFPEGKMPASSFIVVKLASPQLLVEIEAVAMIETP